MKTITPINTIHLARVVGNSQISSLISSTEILSGSYSFVNTSRILVMVVILGTAGKCAFRDVGPWF